LRLSRRALPSIGVGAKGFVADAGDYHGPHIVVVLRFFQGAADHRAHSAVDPVAAHGPVDRDDHEVERWVCG